MRHFPVMREEARHYLAVRQDGCYLDATTGLGGHAEAIAERLTAGRLIACDRDGESLEFARRRLERWKDRIVFRKAAFSELEQTLAELGVAGVDGLIADLGPSYYQMTDPERGFGVNVNGPLDCRMDRSQGPTAADLVNQLPERELADLIYGLAGERRARKIARALGKARPIRTTGELARVVESVAPWPRSRLHPATLTAMALRMACNRELEELEALVESLPRLVLPGGRAVIISFHSGEDRKVKRSFAALAQAGRADLLTKHVVRPSAEEIKQNRASRSGKLRALSLR